MNTLTKTYIVIPAFEPDDKLLLLINDIRNNTNFCIIIINDGSGKNYKHIFTKASIHAHIITHSQNLGKGAALKSAFSYLQGLPEQNFAIITADSDGQHFIQDIICVNDALMKMPSALILGSRQFTDHVPFKSKFGNTITRQIFKLSTKHTVYDTQTGLRAFNSQYLSYMIALHGQRYEYEINMLICWVKDDYPIFEQPIETIYLNKNTGSHFHAVRDSFQIYKELFQFSLFSLSSLVSFLMDYCLYSILIIITSPLSLELSIGISNIVSRLFSACLNFTLNRKFVFGSTDSFLRSAFEYALLACGILILNTMLLTLLTSTLIHNRFIAKIMVESFLFIFSCFVQKRIIFNKTRKA